MLLEINGLVKRYKNITAVDGISFSIEEGICFGLLGQNGAGKTTTVEMLEDIITPTRGTILFKGRERDRNFREKIGIQFQHTELLSFLTVDDTLRTFGRFYKNSLPMEEVRRLCMLEAIGKQMNDRISGGQKQRLLLGLALINDPDLLFLDEPSTGLDPLARQHMWKIIRGVKAQGKSIVLTTHYMEEAQTLCDDIIIMDQGRIIAQGSPETLMAQHCKDDGEPRNLETVFLNLTGRHLRA
ncbi:ABC-type transport system, ATPase component [Desulforapulum autotrophicum HRM2]|uniref:ABC-type transport system, ATPase component n=1 Tax=Desulforapulum autotrophicum (strain ATCC 43914 / DSM 3382 / VKM B-1955 / HRM2) TaxID=177437 RepID=C0QG87_DESAH|nr:ABC transporter ATP-binding protein [Desulforapulum autotrophicum]ACN17666.1 ABC-type transport system, ATPase component [Desulforapulum autotrophicum HRM2]